MSMVFYYRIMFLEVIQYLFDYFSLTKTLPFDLACAVMMILVLPLVRFTCSFTARFVFTEVVKAETDTDTQHRVKLFTSMGLDVGRCMAIEHMIGLFPTYTFVNEVAKFKLKKGTFKYDEFANEFLQRYENTLL
jgi:hypothetical protein